MRMIICALTAMLVGMSSAYAEDITAHCNKGGVQSMATCAMQAELDKDIYDTMIAYDMMYERTFRCADHPSVTQPGTAVGLAQLRDCINRKHEFMEDVRALMGKYGYPSMDSVQGRGMYPRDEEALGNYLLNRQQRRGFAG